MGIDFCNVIQWSFLSLSNFDQYSFNILCFFCWFDFLMAKSTLLLSVVNTGNVAMLGNSYCETDNQFLQRYSWRKNLITTKREVILIQKVGVWIITFSTSSSLLMLWILTKNDFNLFYKSIITWKLKPHQKKCWNYDIELFKIVDW